MSTSLKWLTHVDKTGDWGKLLQDYTTLDSQIQDLAEGNTWYPDCRPDTSNFSKPWLSEMCLKASQLPAAMYARCTLLGLTDSQVLLLKSLLRKARNSVFPTNIRLVHPQRSIPLRDHGQGYIVSFPLIYNQDPVTVTSFINSMAYRYFGDKTLNHTSKYNDDGMLRSIEVNPCLSLHQPT